MRSAPRHLRPAAARRAGFTLLELILAMAIFAVIATTLYLSLRGAFNAKRAAEAAVEPARTAELTLGLLEQDLASAMPITGATADSNTAPTAGATSTTFLGTDQQDDRGGDGDDVQFFTVADSPSHQVGNGEVKEVELTVMPAPTGGDHWLVRKVLRNALAVTPENPDVEVLCRGVRGFNLRYYDGSNWQTSWDATALDYTIPVAVEVTLTLDRPNGNVANADGTRSFRYTRVIALACSTAASDPTVNTGSNQ